MTDGPSVFPGFAAFSADPDDVGASLAARRRALGLSQAQIAQRMGTSQPAVARLESGSTNARLSTVSRYADALGCSIAFSLVDGDT